MRGSYSYIGPDLQTYVVNWFADETGFHPSAPHLPQPVPIPFPDQAAAVAEQIRNAGTQRKRDVTLFNAFQAIPVENEEDIKLINSNVPKYGFGRRNV